jgi:quercetin dioxygenase-like cupin family protein
MRRVSAALSLPAPPRSSSAPRLLPVCEFLHPAVTAFEQHAPDLAPLADALRRLAPELVWRQRSNDDPVFAQSHANAALVGPEPHALEQRSDVRVGISLVAPGVTYPDHRHPPEEVYIVLSEGEWRQESGPWHAPGIGGIVYNPRDIVHAMRSGPSPLLAIWCLPIDARDGA